MSDAGLMSESFEIESGALCFGSLRDILKGANAAVQDLPREVPTLGDTVITQQLKYNVPVRNGPGKAYAPVDQHT